MFVRTQIKVVDPKSKQCGVLAGSGTAGDALGPGFDGAAFNEPGGLCVGESGAVLYVADTNNHRIKVLDLEARTVSLVRPRTAWCTLGSCLRGSACARV